MELFPEPKDVVLRFPESEESSGYKYFREECMLLRRMRSEGCIVKTLGHSRVVWLIVTFQKVTALSLILAVVSST